MLEDAATQILATRVRADGPKAARVELTIADAASLEEATESVVISVRVNIPSDIWPFPAYQHAALGRAVELLREPWRPLEDRLNR